MPIYHFHRCIFYLIQIVIILVCVAFVRFFSAEELVMPFTIMAILLPFLFTRGIVNMLLNKRVKAFDQDYPVMLLSYVSLLKTGMNALYGLEAAGKGLNPGSLVRAEIDLLLERLKLGLSEEQAISAFADDVAHPELDLFVQSLLLSQKVGGQLSQTLERLARQVRKRQQFREQAKSAVAMERGSISAVAFIMSGLLVFMFFSSPELITGAFSDPLGLKILGWSMLLIVFGFIWSRVITNIKV